MAILRCGECGASVSTNARSCPNCGYDASHNRCWSCESFQDDECECVACSKGTNDPACPAYTPREYD